MLFLALEDGLEQIPAHVVSDRLAMGDRRLEVGMRHALELEIATQGLLGRLADPQLAEVLQIGQTFEEQNALHQPIGVFHLVDRLLVFLDLELLEPPVAEHAGMEEILVDRRQLVEEDLVEMRKQLRVAFHRGSPRTD